MRRVGVLTLMVLMAFGLGSWVGGFTRASQLDLAGTQELETRRVNDAFVQRLPARIAGREDEPAEQVFTNIQWLKGVRARQLLLIMNQGYSRALGVACTHCHVEQDVASDDKRPKRAAREMAAMHRAINTRLAEMEHLRSGKKPHVPLVTRWGSMKLADIKRRDVHELLEEIAERGPIMANRTLALVRKIFNFAIERDWLEANPCYMVKPPGVEKPRDRVLNEDEIKRVLAALDREHAVVAAFFQPVPVDRPARAGKSKAPRGAKSTSSAAGGRFRQRRARTAWLTACRCRPWRSGF